MKRWITFLLAAALLCLSGCNYTVDFADGNAPAAGDYDTDTPDGAALAAMDALRRLDFETFDQYSDNHDAQRNTYRILGGDMDVLEGKIARALFGGLTCEAGDVQLLDDRHAQVALHVENTDFSAILVDLMERFVSRYLADGTLEGADAEQQVLEALQKADATQVWARDLLVEVDKTDGVWKLHLDGPLMDAACGGMISSAESMGDQIAQGIENKIAGGLEDWLNP